MSRTYLVVDFTIAYASHESVKLDKLTHTHQTETFPFAKRTYSTTHSLLLFVFTAIGGTGKDYCSFAKRDTWSKKNSCPDGRRK